MKYKKHVTMILGAILFVATVGTFTTLSNDISLVSTGMATSTVLGSDEGIKDQFTNYCGWYDSNDETDCEETCEEKICIPLTEMCDETDSRQCYCCEARE